MTKYALIQRFQSAGFGSHVLTALEGIYQAERAGLIPIVDYRRGSNYYRQKEGENVWDLYFDQLYKAEDIRDNFVIYRYAYKPCPDAIVYGLKNFSNIKGHFDANNAKVMAPFARRCLTTKREIWDRFEDMVRRYDIDFDNTIAVCYRGTDKFLDAPHVGYVRYLHAVDRLLRLNRGARLYVQTDEKEFRDFITARYPNSFYVSEFPVSQKGGAVRHLMADATGYSLGVEALLMILLLSRCRFLVKNSSSLSDVAAYLKGDDNIIHVFSSWQERFYNYLMTNNELKPTVFKRFWHKLIRNTCRVTGALMAHFPGRLYIKGLEGKKKSANMGKNP